ncbi:hypothetical protein AA103196_2299 [Ameyamaea chiangmaiensis NBRC 103196]|uniref:Myb-like domain-containing protein n=1 Tax=Ameyamaea chiangmaiensis TaxID=442969 RepID=A0A850P9P2_9PROT|nr:hypothetical protein [Ameyamaea chiangmaiensis]MBS4075441.1 hypothetical protein [Ameyamaea chiangmaiensis]NVN39026.1 hypothetical protein [Ameyamaea chiangmaiensis]GBQ69748.1 hypothetical protein AA103196_2299 [Ameyamaea chiangmaiensis NBRC 103196]
MMYGIAKVSGPWTEREWQIAVALRREGRSYPVIASRLARSIPSVRNRFGSARAAGVPVDKAFWTEQEVAILLARRAARVPHHEIAEELRRSVDSVISKEGRLQTRLRDERRRAAGLTAPPTARPMSANNRPAKPHRVMSEPEHVLPPARTRDGLPSLAARLVARDLASEIQGLTVDADFVASYAAENKITATGDVLPSVNALRASYGLPPFYLTKPRATLVA